MARHIANIKKKTTLREQCTYPAEWKIGQVTSLFKKDDESSKANYVPVTVLPATNNIYKLV